MAETENPPSSARRDLVILAVLFGLVYFFLLGRAPLTNPDEARYAEIPREMLVRDDWVSPHLNGIPYFEKPPLVYWLGAIGQGVFGPGEAVARSIPALFALGGVLLTYAAARRLFGRETGVVASIVLGTSLLYFALARLLLLDMPVAVLMSATLYCFILGVNTPPGRTRRLLFLGLYAASALATLTKGLIGFALTGGVMFFWLLLFNQWRRLVPLYLPTGALLFLAIAAPWHILASQRNPDWAHFYFVHEHWERFTSDVHDRAEPWWYFIPIILVGLFPWCGFLWGGIRDAVAGGWARRQENANSWFFVLWAGFILLFFSASHSKLVPYVMPLFPALAVLIGRSFVRSETVPIPGRGRGGFIVFGFLCGLIAVALVIAVLRPGVIRDPGQAQSLRPYAYAMAAVLVTGGTLATWLSKVKGLDSAFRMAAATAVIWSLLLGAATVHIRQGTKELAMAYRTLARPGDRIYHYHGFYHDFVFYSGVEVGLVGYIDELGVRFLDDATRAERFITDEEFRRQWSGDDRVVIVARKRIAAPLLAEPAFRHHVLFEGADHLLLSNRP